MFVDVNFPLQADWESKEKNDRLRYKFSKDKGLVVVYGHLFPFLISAPCRKRGRVGKHPT